MKTKTTKHLLLASKISLTAMTFLFSVTMTAGSIAMENSGTITNFLNQTSTNFNS